MRLEDMGLSGEDRYENLTQEKIDKVEALMVAQLAEHPTWYTTIRHLANYAVSELDLTSGEAPNWVMHIAASLLPEGTPEGEIDVNLQTEEEHLVQQNRWALQDALYIRSRPQRPPRPRSS